MLACHAARRRPRSCSPTGALWSESKPDSCHTVAPQNTKSKNRMPFWTSASWRRRMGPHTTSGHHELLFARLGGLCVKQSSSGHAPPCCATGCICALARTPLPNVLHACHGISFPRPLLEGGRPISQARPVPGGNTGPSPDARGDLLCHPYVATTTTRGGCCPTERLDYLEDSSTVVSDTNTVGV